MESKSKNNALDGTRTASDVGKASPSWDKWETWFGEPQYEFQVSKYANQKRTTPVLPEAYKGKNLYLGKCLK